MSGTWQSWYRWYFESAVFAHTGEFLPMAGGIPAVSSGEAGDNCLILL